MQTLWIWPSMLGVNSSLSSGVSPSQFKEAHIISPLRSDSLDVETLSSYRPVSNLTFISKVLESAVNRQLMDHFNKHGLLHQNQYAYRVRHSVETAFQHVSFLISQELDSGRSVFLVFVDFSAAFDTVTHQHLLSILSSRFFIGWICSQMD